MVRRLKLFNAVKDLYSHGSLDSSANSFVDGLSNATGIHGCFTYMIAMMIELIDSIDDILR